MSERKVGKSLDNIFKGCDKRVVISTFSSNVHRVQQIIDFSHKYGRKVALTGRSMLNVIAAAHKYGYMDIPEGTLIDINDIKRFKPEELTIITTGSQGEPMSALYRMAFAEHDKVLLSESDLVVISATTIPGNEKLVTKIVNELHKKGVTLLNDAVADVHVSGHACQEELKIILSLVKPKYFLPIHGEYRHLKAHADLAVEMGMERSDIIIPDQGMVIELSEDGIRNVDRVQSGKVLIDGLGVGDVGSVVLRVRRHLAQDGLIVVVAAINTDIKEIITGPEIVSRGFVYVKEAEELMEGLRGIAEEAIIKCFDNDILEWNAIKGKIKDALTTYIYSITKRKPMILPVIMEV
jgi:ribonuclease J